MLLVFWILPFISQLTTTLSWPWLLDDVSLYIEISPIAGKLVALEKLVGLFVFVARKKFVVTTLFFLSLQKTFHRGKRYWPFPCLTFVISINCALSYLVILKVSYPIETSR